MNTPLSSAQVWHAFSRDLTVLPAHPAFLKYTDSVTVRRHSSPVKTNIVHPSSVELITHQVDLRPQTWTSE